MKIKSTRKFCAVMYHVKPQESDIYIMHVTFTGTFCHEILVMKDAAAFLPCWKDLILFNK